jgi:hypothetical protein
MSNITISDIAVHEDLDSKAMTQVRGGYGFVFNRPTTIPVEWPPKPIVDKDDPKIPTPDDLPPHVPTPPPAPQPTSGPGYRGGWGRRRGISIW